MSERKKQKNKENHKIKGSHILTDRLTVQVGLIDLYINLVHLRKKNRSLKDKIFPNKSYSFLQYTLATV